MALPPTSNPRLVSTVGAIDQFMRFIDDRTSQLEA